MCYQLVLNRQTWWNWVPMGILSTACETLKWIAIGFAEVVRSKIGKMRQYMPNEASVYNTFPCCLRIRRTVGTISRNLILTICIVNV